VAVVFGAMFLFCGCVTISGTGQSCTFTVMVLLGTLIAGVHALTLTQYDVVCVSSGVVNWLLFVPTGVERSPELP
jgi:hypothetical protein